jgi:iron complex transport system substrate-binding protein
MRPFRPRRQREVTPAFVLALLLVAGCAAATPTGTPKAATSVPATLAPTTAPSPTPAAFPTTVTDDEGTAVTVSAEPQKIVSLTPAATEILYALGAGPRVVAKVEDVANFPPAAASLPVVATYKGVDVEKIVAANADLVVSGGVNFGQGDAVTQLRKANVPVIVVNPTSTSGALADIRFIGQATGLSDNATAYADSMQTAFDTIKSATAGIAHPKVFYETGNYPALYGIADGSLYAEMITLAGGTPVTTGSTTDYTMPLEKLVTANPDIILLGDAAYGVTADQVKARSGWKTIAAVQSGAIYPVDDVVITRPGPRLVDGLLALLKAIHPDLAQKYVNSVESGCVLCPPVIIGNP